MEDEHGDVKTYHFSGDSIESLTMCSTMIRGPCCDWHSNSTKLETREAEIDDPEIICLLAEAEDQLMTIHVSESVENYLYYALDFSSL